MLEELLKNTEKITETIDTINYAQNTGLENDFNSLIGYSVIATVTFLGMYSQPIYKSITSLISKKD